MQKRLSAVFGVDKGKIKPFTEEDRGENSSQESVIDLAGSGAKHVTPQKMKQLLDKLREEQNGL
jgi:chromosome segregation and condensation protein ScpB